MESKQVNSSTSVNWIQPHLEKYNESYPKFLKETAPRRPLKYPTIFELEVIEICRDFLDIQKAKKDE